MRKLLIPLLAAIALPTAVNAENYYFMGRFAGSGGVYVAPMETEKLCEEAGKKFTTRSEWSKNMNGILTYICLKAKE